MLILDFLINWVLLPAIIIYGFVSWGKEHPNTKFFIDPDEKKDQSKQKVKEGNHS